MLTKKVLKNWLNYSLLAITLACIVGVALMSKLDLGEKAAIIGGILVALRAAVPDIRKQGVDVIDGLDIPEGSTVTQTTDVSTVSTTTTTVTTPPEQGTPTASSEAITKPTIVPIAGSKP